MANQAASIYPLVYCIFIFIFQFMSPRFSCLHPLSHAAPTIGKDFDNTLHDIISFGNKEMPYIPLDLLRSIIPHLAIADVSSFSSACKAFHSATRGLLVEEVRITQTSSPIFPLHEIDLEVDMTPKEAVDFVMPMLEGLSVGTLYLSGIDPEAAVAILNQLHSNSVHTVCLQNMHVTHTMPLARFSHVILEGHVTFVEALGAIFSPWVLSRESLTFARRVTLKHVPFREWPEALQRTRHIHCDRCFFATDPTVLFDRFTIYAHHITFSGCDLAHCSILALNMCRMNNCRLRMETVFGDRPSTILTMHNCTFASEPMDRVLQWITRHEGTHSISFINSPHFMSVEVAAGIVRVLL